MIVQYDMIIQYSIIIIVLVLVACAIVKLNKKDIALEMNKFVKALGGNNNIKSIELNKSRCKVELKEIDLIDKDSIMKLGAKGIVEIDNQLKIVLDNSCKQLKKCIDDYIVENKKIK